MRKLSYSLFGLVSAIAFVGATHSTIAVAEDHKDEATLAAERKGAVDPAKVQADFSKLATSLKNWGGGSVNTKKPAEWEGTTVKVYPTSAELKEAGALVEKIKIATDKMEKDCGKDPSAKLASDLFKQCFAKGGLARAASTENAVKVDGDRWQLAINAPELAQCRTETDKYFTALRGKVGKTQTNWQLEKDINRLFETTWAAKTPKEPVSDNEKKWVNTLKDQGVSLAGAVSGVEKDALCKPVLAGPAGTGTLAGPVGGPARGTWGGASMCGGSPCGKGYGGNYSAPPGGYNPGSQYTPNNYYPGNGSYQPKGLYGGGYGGVPYQPQQQPYGGGGGGGYSPPPPPPIGIGGGGGGGRRSPYPPGFGFGAGGGQGGFMPIIPPSGGGVGCGGLCTVAQPLPTTPPVLVAEIKATTTPIPPAAFNPLAMLQNPCLAMMGAAGGGLGGGFPSLYGAMGSMMPMMQGAANLMMPQQQQARINPLCLPRFPQPGPISTPFPPRPGYPQGPGPIVTPNPNYPPSTIPVNPNKPVVTPVNPNLPPGVTPVNPNQPGNNVGNIGRDSGSVPRGTGTIN